MALSKANVSKASHDLRPLRYKNREGGSRLLLYKNGVMFPATIFINTYDKKGVIEIEL